MTSLEKYKYDVVVIGAGGAGLRAAVEARAAGLSVAIVCKSLFGKAHTVMAEGGAAASMGNVNEKDNWQVHFRDTMRGGKFLNHYRMAELHAKESPDRIWELEVWGALFDRTKEGKISQRNFGGHEYPRLAHVGDRTGLELIRTMQQRIVALQQQDAKESGNAESHIKVFAELTITEILKENGKIAGAYGYWRENGNEVLFEAPTVIVATGGVGKTFKITSNSWEGTGDGHALALKAGANLVDMEFLQFHPTGMVWPPSVRGILVTESVRGEGGILTNSLGERFMFKYIPEVFKDKYADNEAEADRWYLDQDNNRRPPELLPRDEVSRAINAEVKAGRGTEHGGVYLDVSKRIPADVIKKRLPSMWHQFYELAGVDITKEAMEVGPTCHYVMGGVEVEPDTAAAVGVPGLFAAGEVAGGMHGSNRLGGNSLSDLLVFGRRAGMGAVEYVKKNPSATVSEKAIADAAARIQAPFSRAGGENSYSLHAELQEITHNLVGIIRTGKEVEEAIVKIAAIRARSANVAVAGDRKFNPGFHLAFDLDNMLLVAESTAKSALLREESRGGHTRDDFPGMSSKWRQVNHISSFDGEKVNVKAQPLPPIPKELFDLFDIHELEKYMTPEEIAKGGSN
ncbi:MAG: fumarate reductase/succinate dehydrogenase flavoprotein subunit [Actinobacteria bacterium]|jgi:succinate dehydrogenase / fumarate reductase flavoprotein subunit|nr:fumarate reductase/succinate dehydrogenase flavoprotein subunit [Actinomycetota bacterium]